MKYIKEYNNYLVEKSKNDPIPEIYNDKLCIILLGAPGVGKSTFINNYILTKNKNIKVFSTDDISLILTKDPNIYDERSSDMNIRKLEMYIESERSFIYDTTGTQIDNIIKITKLSKDKNYKILYIQIMATLDLIINQNNNRERKVPIDYIKLSYKKQYTNMKYLYNLNPDSYYIVYNLDGKYKFMKYDGKMNKRKNDKYIKL